MSAYARPPILLCGPTAVGKSAVALCLAEELGGEIISVDSMQVYRGMDIGTAKPGGSDRRRIAHHLLDLINVRETFDAASFVTHAEASVRDIQSRGNLPIFCGGTGLYFKAWLSGLGEAPPGEPALRAELEATPLKTLLAELAQRDPQTFARIDRQNPRRVYRALEVIRITGQPFSAQRSTWASDPDPGRGICIGLCRGAEDLGDRIERRVDQMFAAGLIAETKALMDEGLEQNRNAMQALGYRQVVEHLRGTLPYEEAINEVKTRTRRYAKKQMNWFKRQLPVIWISADRDTSTREVAAKVKQLWLMAGGLPGGGSTENQKG